MHYYNYLTTPSGKYCILNELSNREYLILLKFLQADNYKGFFENLNEKISETIPDFDDLDIVDKCYIYMTLCTYSIRSVARVVNKFIGDQEIELTLLLENIEKSYKEKKIDFQLSEKIKITFGNPKKFHIDESNNIIIDYLSNIICVNGVKTTPEQQKKLLNALSTKQKMMMEQTIMDNLQDKFDIFENVPMNKLEIPLYRFPIIMNVAGLYRMGLKSFYDMMYMCLRHAKIDYEGFMDLSYMETDIILKTCLEEKREETRRMSEAMGGEDS